MPTIEAKYEFENNIKTASCKVNRISNSCPICHNGIKPIHRFGWVKFQKRKLWIVFECPIQECGSIFHSYYIEPVKTGIPEDIFEFVGNAPRKIKKEVFPGMILNISIKFFVIYNEAKEAEERGLKKICGAGYRKALEFLIKDYLIHMKVEKPDKIKEARLYDCIKDYVSSDPIKDCAKRAAWLGNDETHYIREWKDKDLDDLKELIHLTVDWIYLEIRTKRIKSDMPEKKVK